MKPIVHFRFHKKYRWAVCRAEESKPIGFREISGSPSRVTCPKCQAWLAERTEVALLNPGPKVPEDMPF